MRVNSLFEYKSVASLLNTTPVLDITNDGLVDRVIIDSRKGEAGALFIPLKGEVTDGNLFIRSALEKGCRISLVSEDFYNKDPQAVESLAEEFQAVILPCEDTLLALHSLARAHIQKFKGLLTIGLTGSSGKTTTKEVLGSMLSCWKKTLITEGNYNSETGLPLTVFRITEEHEVALLEMGMNRPGEIKALVDIVHPYMGIITNIGTAHIGAFDTHLDLAREKKSVFDNFSGSNIAVFPESDGFAEFLKEDVNGHLRLVPDKPELVESAESLGLKGWLLKIQGKEVHYPLSGEYNLKNAWIAMTAAMALGVDTECIIQGLRDVTPLFGRGEILEGRVTLIRDCYNANPDSMLRSLEFVSSLKWEGKKHVVLGSMLELGSRSDAAHKEVVLKALDLDVDRIYLYGEEFHGAFTSLTDKKNVFFGKSIEELRSFLVQETDEDDLVLLKGSRGMQLENLTDSLI